MGWGGTDWGSVGASAFTDDALVLLASSDHHITIGEITRPCLFFCFDEPIQQPSVGAPETIRVIKATIPVSEFAAVAIGDSCTIVKVNADAEVLTTNNYRVLDVRAICGDGVLKDLYLENA